jgi:hypothetical protein
MGEWHSKTKILIGVDAAVSPHPNPLPAGEGDKKLNAFCSIERAQTSLYPVGFYCVKLSLPLFNQFLASARRKLWLKRKNARTHHVRVRNRLTASTAARHVKEPATQSSSIVIAATKVVREISESWDKL